MQCAICGKEIINENVSKDHVFPRAIWKWQEETLDVASFSVLKKAIESSSNIVKVHRKCNLEKQEVIVNLDELFLSEKQRVKLEIVRESVTPYIDGYFQKKKTIFEKQAGKCYLCNAPLLDDMVLRRINKKATHSIENGCLLCNACSVSKH